MHISKKIRSWIRSWADLRALDHKALRRVSATSPIITISTTPKRIVNLKPTLVSFLSQQLPPREVQINIGDDLFKNNAIPDFILGLETVKLYKVAKDLGPATKFIPSLERWRNTEQLLIVADDDMIYPADWAARLVAADAQFGRRNCYCINGVLIHKSLRSEDCSTGKTLPSGKRRVAIVQGAGGYTLRPDFVDSSSLLNLMGAPSRALFDDDVWISGHLSRAGITKFQIAGSRRHGTVNTIESAIGGNRAELGTQLLEHFRLDWKDGEYYA